MVQETTEAFALRLSEAIMSQVEEDRGLDKQKIADLIVREVSTRSGQDASKVVIAAENLMAVLRAMRSVNWPSEAMEGYANLEAEVRRYRGGML